MRNDKLFFSFSWWHWWPWPGTGLGSCLPCEIRALLGLHNQACEYIDTLPAHEILKLVYRDHIVLKHASRKRLASEMADTTKELEAHDCRDGGPVLAALGNHGETLSADILSKMLVRYLLLVLWLITNRCV